MSPPPPPGAVLHELLSGASPLRASTLRDTLLHARRADGLLYWGVNYWPGFEARTLKPPPAKKKWPNVPWNDAGRNGDGYLIYPGVDGPLPSLRLEIVRDGVEDHDALRMLADLLKQKGDRVPAALRDRARKALAVSPDVFRSMADYPADAGALVARRRLVNELIVLFLKAAANKKTTDKERSRTGR